MDLALHLGMTTAGLTRSMSEREFREWQQYAARRMLPMRRIELYLAQIAQWVARSMGAADAPLADFLFDPVEDEAVDGSDDITPEDLAEQFGGTVYRKQGI